jgi:hypothetical protein
MAYCIPTPGEAVWVAQQFGDVRERMSSNSKWLLYIMLRGKLVRS